MNSYDIYEFVQLSNEEREKYIQQRKKDNFAIHLIFPGLALYGLADLTRLPNFNSMSISQSRYDLQSMNIDYKYSNPSYFIGVRCDWNIFSILCQIHDSQNKVTSFTSFRDIKDVSFDTITANVFISAAIFAFNLRAYSHRYFDFLIGPAVQSFSICSQTADRLFSNCIALSVALRIKAFSFNIFQTVNIRLSSEIGVIRRLINYSFSSLSPHYLAPHLCYFSFNLCVI